MVLTSRYAAVHPSCCTRWLKTALVLTVLTLSAFSTPQLYAASTVSGSIAQGLHGAEYEDQLQQIWVSRTQDIADICEEAEQAIKKVKELAPALQENQKKAREQFTKLSGLYRASRGHPTEQLTIVQQMHTLKKGLQDSLAPYDSTAVSLALRLEDIERQQQDIRTFYAENKDLKLSANAALKSYEAALNKAARRLSNITFELNNITTLSRTVLERVQRNITDIEKSLSGIWENYYFTPSSNSLSSLVNLPQTLNNWALSLGSRFSFAYPQTALEWLNAAKMFFSSAFIMALIGIFAYRSSYYLPARWRKACRQIINSAWVLISLGWSLLLASSDEAGDIYLALIVCSALLMVLGLAAMSWRLRRAVIPELKAESSPLKRLFIPAAAGTIMLFADLPLKALGLIWVSLLTIFILIAFYRNKHQPYKHLPFLERMTYVSATYLGLLSLIVSAAGYARLAILIFMLLFAVINTFTLGNALMGLFDALIDRIFAKKNKPILNALTQAISIPLAWVLSLICMLPWLWVIPGAKYLLKDALATSYTVGEASFDITRILIVVLLFFLFRSFIRLGQTSLEHLPQNMPYLEKGIIPPLRSIVTYLLWAVFTLIVLAMLGVNFTSLAVVLGGLSVGIGLGMQNIFNNFVSGMLLLFGRTLAVGDIVEVEGVTGTVKAINVRTTLIETAERAVVYVPNSTVMAGKLVNWTRNNKMVRCSLNIGVAYGSDTTKVNKALLSVANEHPRVLKRPPAKVLFNNFGDSALDFTLNVFVDDYDNVSTILSELRFNTEKLFQELNIDIPYPQLTLHVADNVNTTEFAREQMQDALPQKG